MIPLDQPPAAGQNCTMSLRAVVANAPGVHGRTARATGTARGRGECRFQRLPVPVFVI